MFFLPWTVTDDEHADITVSEKILAWQQYFSLEVMFCRINVYKNEFAKFFVGFATTETADNESLVQTTSSVVRSGPIAWFNIIVQLNITLAPLSAVTCWGSTDTFDMLGSRVEI